MVPMLAGYYALARRASAAGPFEASIAPHLLSHLMTGQEGRARLTPLRLLLPFIMVASVAAAGPTWELADTPEAPDDSAVVLVVDLSRSMDCEDVGPSRIGRARLKLLDLLEVRRGAPTGLIVVGGSAHIVMPLTDDVEALRPYIDVLAPDLMPTDGEAFAAAAPLVASLAGASDAPTTAILITDGIPPDGVDAFTAMAAETGVTLGVWAVGTDAGRPAEGLPGLDHTGIDRLGRDAGAEVIELSLGTGDLRQVQRLLDRSRRAAADADDARLWEDGGYALVPFLALIVSLWFRRGWVLPPASPAAVMLALAFGLPFITGCTDPRVMGVFMTPDQQGRYFLERGEYAEAGARFEDPMWKGAAFYAAGDWAEAKEAYRRVDTPVGLYNLGNAHAQARDIVSAIASYDRALARRPTYAEARANRDLLQGILDGLEESTDLEEYQQPPSREADSTAARLNEDQLLADEDRPVGADAERGDPESEVAEMSAELSDQWMQRVATTPADFLRAKFALQAVRGGR